MNFINRLRRKRYIYLERRRLKRQIISLSRKDKLRLNIGSGTLHYEGWVNLDLPFFDLTHENLWKYFFKNRPIKNILLEHVLEHLTEKNVEISLSLAKQFLHKDATIRIAVPDKFHPSEEYIENVRPGGIDKGSDDHHSFWSYLDFQKLVKNIGLKANFLEYYDENGKFHKNAWDKSDGVIKRDSVTMANSRIKGYTSLILDVTF